MSGMNKKVWIPLLVAGVAITGTSAGLAIYYATRKTPGRTYTITLDLNGGTIEGVKDKIKVAHGATIGSLPTPVNPGFSFIGWVKSETNETIDPETVITSNMQLTATYEVAPVEDVSIEGGRSLIEITDEESSSTFLDETQWTLKIDGEDVTTGVTYSLVDNPTGVSIDSNTAVISWSNDGSYAPEQTYTFKVKGTKNKYSAEAVITFKVYHATVTVDFVPLSSQQVSFEGETHFEVIKDHIHTTAATKFSDIPAPVPTLERSDFIKWIYYGGTKAGQDVQPNDVFTGNTTICPSFDPTTIEYHLANGSSLLEGTTGGDGGSDDKTWQLLNQYDEEVTGVTWVIENGDAGISISNGKVSWNNTLIAGIYKFDVVARLGTTSTYEVARTPVILSLTNPIVVSVSGASSQILGTTQTTQELTYTSSLPSSKYTTTWSVAGDAQTLGISINEETGVLNLGDNITKHGTIQVIAHAQSLDGKINVDSDPFNVNILLPWESHEWSNYICTYIDEGTSQLPTGWYAITDLSDSVNLTLKSIKDTTKTVTVARHIFTGNVTVGTRVQTIGDNFLSDCDTLVTPVQFGSKIETLAAETDKLPLISIGDSFMENCSNFNQTLVLPDTVQFIGDYFLKNATAFKNGNTATSTTNIPFTIQGSKTLGTKLDIGDDFMYGCDQFDNSIIVDSTVSHIGENFLYNLKSMTKRTTNPSVITLNVNYDVLDAYVENPLTFAAFDDNVSWPEAGLPIVVQSETNKTELMNRFKDMAASETSFYRKLDVRVQAP